jgi:hypothetical protein
MKDLELRLTDLLARKADEVDVRPVDGFAETPYTTALASTDLDSVTETRDLATIDLEATNARPAPSRNRRRVAQGVLAAAAAVVAIAVVATHDGEAPTDEPSPIATVPPTTPPRPLPNTNALLAPGTYFVDEVSGTPTPRIFFTIGAGWENMGDAGIGKVGKRGVGDGPGLITFDRPGAVFSDACHPSDGYHPGPLTTFDGLVAALSEQQGWAEVTAPSDISIDGYVGKAFQRTAPADMVHNCGTRSDDIRERIPDDVPGYPDFRSWEDLDAGSGFAGFYYEPGEIETLWVLDIDGTVVVISTGLWPGPSAADHADFAAVLDSIRIDRG